MAGRVDVIVPVLNEEASIDEFYARAEALGLARALIFVDNASTDGTVARIERLPGVRLVRHETNRGYGASIRSGIASSDGDRIVIIDADLEYPPEAIPRILDALRDHAVVYGSRFLGPDRPDMPLFRRVGNRLISGLYNLLFRQHTTDFYTGMKGMRRDALPFALLRQNGFEHGIELGALIAEAGAKIHDVPVRYVPRTHGRSKMRHIPETLKGLAYLVAYRLRWIGFAASSDAARNTPLA